MLLSLILINSVFYYQTVESNTRQSGENISRCHVLGETQVKEQVITQAGNTREQEVQYVKRAGGEYFKIKTGTLSYSQSQRLLNFHAVIIGNCFIPTPILLLHNVCNTQQCCLLLRLSIINQLHFSSEPANVSIASRGRGDQAQASRIIKPSVITSCRQDNRTKINLDKGKDTFYQLRPQR